MNVTAIGMYSNFYFFICCDVLEICIFVLMRIPRRITGAPIKTIQKQHHWLAYVYITPTNYWKTARVDMNLYVNFSLKINLPIYLQEFPQSDHCIQYVTLFGWSSSSNNENKWVLFVSPLVREILQSRLVCISISIPYYSCVL